MASQQYRGYVVQVSSFGIVDLYAYRTSIRIDGSGELSYQDVSLGVLFGTSTSAQDAAFRNARAWIESHPRPWLGPAR